MKMYLKFEEVILVSDKSKLQSDDPVIYEHYLRGERILTLDFNPSKYAVGEKIYGHLYFDAQENPCVVPDTQEQFEADCMCARDWR